MSDFFNNTVFLDTVTQDSIFYGLIVYIHKGLELCLDKFLSLVFHCSTILHVLGVKKYLMKKYTFFFFLQSIFPNIFFLKKFYWKIIALQYCVGLCHTLIWISHRYIYIPSLVNLPPTSTPSHPSRLSRSFGLSSLSHTVNSHWLSILHMVMYMSSCYPLHLSHHLLHLPHCVHKFALCVCISAAALQIGDITKFPKGIVGASFNSLFSFNLEKIHCFTLFYIRQAVWPQPTQKPLAFQIAPL